MCVCLFKDVKEKNILFSNICIWLYRYIFFLVLFLLTYPITTSFLILDTSWLPQKTPYIIDQFILLLYFRLVRIQLVEFNQIDNFSLFSITPCSRVLYRFQIWSIPDIFFCFSKWKFFIFLPMIHFFSYDFLFLAVYVLCIFSFILITFLKCLLCYSMRHLRFQTIYSKHIENQINFILKCHYKHVIK